MVIKNTVDGRFTMSVCCAGRPGELQTPRGEFIVVFSIGSARLLVDGPGVLVAHGGAEVEHVLPVVHNVGGVDHRLGE